MSTSITADVPLSGSTDFLGIKIAATAATGTTIHTATSTSGVDDEIYIYATNSDTADHVLTIEWGGVTSPDNEIKMTIPAQAGLILVIPGLRLRNSKVVYGFADSTNKIIVYGFVNRITN